MPDEVAEVRNELRDLFDLLEIKAVIRVGTVGTTTRIVLSPMALGDARRLARALDGCEAAQPTPGTVRP